MSATTDLIEAAEAARTALLEVYSPTFIVTVRLTDALARARLMGETK